ncbi:DUF654-domain-containing protein [Daedalea quercina L-15889]|uniref:DUF654-domain-containing protein n=1 Tax=Daedalea quercina L-15889 TaxID=1314783 RepID=A0A165NJE2_9APHY|nr:DUF654-domain-containing protein [Daedalea quercina L-15889]
MAPRMNRRQLREQEELAALEIAKAKDETLEAEESEAELPQPGKSAGGGFAAVSSPHQKKKKKHAGTESPAAPTPPPEVSQVRAQDEASPTPSPSRSKKEKKAAKKQKAREQKDDRDDVDKALAELSIKYPDLQQVMASASASPAAHSASTALASLLSVSVQNLDAEAELRKFFGSRVISAAKSSDAGSSKRAAAAAARLKSQAKATLARPKDNWWPANHRQGLSSRQYTQEDEEKMRGRHAWSTLLGEKVWTVEYSKKYRGVTLAFMQTVMSGDPAGFNQILGQMPYHADTLLQMSEVYFHREEHSTAADMIDRALFGYERAFLGTSFNFTTGVNRLDFDRVENRPFFLAVHRQISDLQGRGCVRTSFEFSRLLYSLDPWTDPHGALLHLDYLALKAGMGQWLLDVWDFFSKVRDDDGFRNRLRPTVLPGWAYSRALALYVDEEAKGGVRDHAQSTAALAEAILAFPSIVPVLADKTDISLSASARGHSAFRVYPDASSLSTSSASILHLLSHLYAQRSSPLWKIPERASWFAQTVNASLSSLPPSYDTTQPAYLGFVALYSRPEMAYGVYRHAIVNESTCRRLFGFIPREVTNAKHLACDPLPPPTRVNEYDAEFFRGAEDVLSVQPRSRKANERLLQQLIPDPVFRRQMQDFWAAHPGFQRQFPGGFVHFAQVLHQIGPEAVEDLMIQVADQAAQGAGDGMPGGFMPMDEMLGELVGVAPEAGPVNVDDAAEEDTEEEEDEEDEEEPVAPLPVRMLRNLVNRFWGGGAAEEVSSEEDQDGEDPPPEDGVD